MYRDAVVINIGGQLRRRQRLAALRQNQIDIGIGGHIEVDNQPHLPVRSSVQRIHVVHVVHPAHLLFDRSGDGLFHGLRVGPHIDGGNLNLRRRDGGKLGDRQPHDNYRAGDDGKDRDHHRHNRTVDKEFRHGGSL